MMNNPTIVDKLQDLIKQATTERSHYYVATTALETKEFIHRLCAAIDHLKSINEELTHIILNEIQRYHCIGEARLASKLRKAWNFVRKHKENEDFDTFLGLVDVLLQQLDENNK